MKKKNLTGILLTLLIALCSCISVFAQEEADNGYEAYFYVQKQTGVELAEEMAKIGYDAYFYVKKEAFIEDNEPESQPVYKYYTGKKIAGLISELKVVTGSENVKEFLVDAPTAAEFAKKGVPVDPETEYIEWYVIKKEPDNWHVDGIIQPKLKVVFDYNDSFMGEDAKGEVTVYAEPGTSINTLEPITSSTWTEIDEYGNEVTVTRTFEQWELEEDAYAPGTEITVDKNMKFVAKYKVTKTVVAGVTDETTTEEVTTEETTTEEVTTEETTTEEATTEAPTLVAGDNDEIESEEDVVIEEESIPLVGIVLGDRDDKEETVDIIENEVPLVNSAQTGDNANVMKFVVIACLAVSTLAVIRLSRKTSENN